MTDIRDNKEQRSKAENSEPLNIVDLQAALELLREEIAERRRAEETLQSIEWLLRPMTKGISYIPAYGDITQYNKNRTILNAVGKETLTDIANDFLDLLGTSCAIYEKNGDYAAGIFSSGWCRFLDKASFTLCGTDDPPEALVSGKWLCHESCWTNASKESMNTGKPVDIECHGGIHLYAVPVISGGEIIGSINFGYGDPPGDEDKLSGIASKYGVDINDLKRLSQEYEKRPPFVIDIAKGRIRRAASMIALMVERKQVEDELKMLYAELEQRVKERTADLQTVNERLLKEIAERKQAEDALIASEARFRSLFESMMAGVIIQDAGGKIIQANPAACAILGLSMDQMMGRTAYDERWRLIKEDGTQYNPGEMPSEVALRTGRSVSNFLTGIFVPEKEEYRWILINSVPIKDEKGQPITTITTFTDITGRKLAEEALKESEEKFSRIFQTAPLLITLSGIEDGRYLDVNDEFVRVSGFSREECIGRTSTEIGWISAADRLVLKETVQRDGRIDGMELELTAKDQRKLICLYSGEVISIRGRKVLLSTAQDITDRKQVEEKLHESQRKLALHLEQTIFAVIEWDKEFMARYWNPAAERIFGFSKDEAVGKWGPHLIISKDIHADIDKIWRKLLTQSGGTYNINENITKDGRAIICEWINTPLLDEDGNVTGVMSIANDITERKKSEEALYESEIKFRTAIESYTDGYWLVDGEARILEINEAYSRQSGYTREELLGMHISQLEVIETAEDTRAHINKVMSEGSDIFETMHRKKDGTLWNVEVNAVYSPAIEGRLFCTFRDITERKKTEEALMNALKEKETLVQEVHHRVKNNLFVLQSLISLQQSSLTGRETVDEILNTTKLRISAISKVHQMLYQSENLSEINIGEYIRSFTNDIITAFDAEKRNIGISLDLEPGMLGIEKAIPCGIIINELLTNTFKYAFTGRDYGNISISFRQKDDAFELEIRDDGVGMPEEFISEETRSLGLQLVTILTRQLRGRLEYKRDNGSIFKIIF